jgi:hypothetical protein
VTQVSSIVKRMPVADFNRRNANGHVHLPYRASFPESAQY